MGLRRVKKVGLRTEAMLYESNVGVTDVVTVYTSLSALNSCQIRWTPRAFNGDIRQTLSGAVRRGRERGVARGRQDV